MTIGLITLGAYALLTILFVAGLALAAHRPVPHVDDLIPLPVTNETAAFEKAA